MPWKGEKDPYKIWISEIILQQTRVQQGLGYYERFIRSFPDVKSLATAPEVKVFKHWERLGYYARCKNLIASAQYIQEELKGEFPKNYEEILMLKGVGTYTAAAIASFAFNLPYAVVDGNVFRVLSRFFGLSTPINTTGGKQMYRLLAQQLLDKKNPGLFNQAIMDFGAIICKPALPLCFTCPLQINCIAFQKGKVMELPVNEKKILQTKRYFNYLIIEANKGFVMRKRTGKDIWQNLYEFVLIETEEYLETEELVKNKKFSAIMKAGSWKINFVSKKFTQKLTHQIIAGRFIHIAVSNLSKPFNGYKFIAKKEIEALPFPKFIASYLKDKNVSLNLNE